MLKPQQILGKLGLAQSEVDVYLALLAGKRSVRDMMKTSKMKRPTIYYALRKLEELGLAQKTGKTGTERYEPASPERLETIIARKQQDLDTLSNEVKSLVPLLVSKKPQADKKPEVSFYEGVDAVKNVIMESLYAKSRHHDTIVPEKNFFHQTKGGFKERFVEDRVRRKITTRNLWETQISPAVLKKYYSELSKVRLLPKEMRGNFETTIFLYDDKVLYISSVKNAYCLVVHSAEHYQTTKAIFETLWNTSKKMVD